MARSVSYPSGAAAVTFGQIDLDDEFDWADEVADFRWQVRHLWPSAYATDHWLGREDRVVAANRHAYFGLSEYCGLVSYWLVPRDDTGHPELSAAWCLQVAPRFVKEFGTLSKVGTFSNGGGVYERKDGAPVGPDQFEDKPYVIGGLLTDG